MKVGFFGAGRMACALCKGFLKSSLVKPADIMACDINRSKLREIRQELGVLTTSDNMELIKQNEVIYLAVKPLTIASVLKNISPYINVKHTVFVSIAAGVTTKTMESLLPDNTRVIRVMPNIACVVQSGACVFARGAHALAEDADLVTEMLSCVGLVEEMPENLMDAVTGLSGNGPSYGFVTIQALADGGVKMGLNRDQSLRLAAQTLLGAARMVLNTGQHPEALKDEVCSPGGTSIHALHELDSGGFRGLLMAAVQAGTLRSKELGSS